MTIVRPSLSPTPSRLVLSLRISSVVSGGHLIQDGPFHEDVPLQQSLLHQAVQRLLDQHLRPETVSDPLTSALDGIGLILALTIMLETGEIRRFPTVGDFASYCRCVGSTQLSNRKCKGHGNTKNGNKYLAWAFVEAAHFAVRYNAQIRRYYQRKMAKTHRTWRPTMLSWKGIWKTLNTRRKSCKRP